MNLPALTWDEGIPRRCLALCATMCDLKCQCINNYIYSACENWCLRAKVHTNKMRSLGKAKLNQDSPTQMQRVAACDQGMQKA